MIIRWRANLLALAFVFGGASAVHAVETRDGAHDFDFRVGTWKTHIERLQKPLSGSKNWITLDGSVTVRPIWGGKALLEEIDAQGGGTRMEGLTLFLYNPETRQWALSFSNVKSGRIDAPVVGEFKNGRGEFYGADTLDGRGILVRIVWSDFLRDSYRFEQSFSADGGATWEPNFVARVTRVTS